MQVESLLIVSTAHITTAEAEALTEAGYSRGEFGWFVYVGDFGDGDAAIPELSALSDGFAEVIEAARASHCRYVLFDRDAEPLHGLPIYNTEGC